MAEVSLSGVWKIYDGGVAAVKDVNLSIAHGEFTVLVGPSGCGKSTTLRMIAGLEEISKGEIRIADRVVNEVPPKDRDIAMVFQNYALYPHMSVYDNMAFGLKLRGEKKAEIDRLVRDAAQILGLTEYLARRPKALSGGQRQRVAMGRAIVREPAVFLFDEPLSNLDAKMRVEMRKEIIQLHRRIATTMIYVTHDQIEAMTLGDRIVVMKDGIVQQAGAPTEVFDHPANMFVAGFIGTPPMNLFPGDYASGVLTLATGDRLTLTPGQCASLDAAGAKSVYWGIRPRAFRLATAEEAEGTPVLTAEVEVLEMLGEEVSAHLRLGETSFVITADPHERDRFGDTVKIVPDVTRSHVFDGPKGTRLT